MTWLEWVKGLNEFPIKVILNFTDKNYLNLEVAKPLDQVMWDDWKYKIQNFQK